MMEPRIETLTPKKLAGRRMAMSLAEDRTAELWGGFMPLRKDILNSVGTELYSVQVYGPGYFTPFDPSAPFEKWAAVEVADLDHLPHDMEPFQLPGGLYAVFLHRGGPAIGPTTFRFIFTEWLPRSGFELDQRPHFEVLGEKYKGNDPESEEEIWIPIKSKG